MGRLVIIAVFSLCFVLSIWVFLNREEKPIKEKIKKSLTRQSLVVDEFTSYRFNDAELVGSVSAKMGQFVEPNSLELKGDFRAQRLINGKYESLRSERATAFFDTDSLGKMMSGTDLVRSELKEKVVVDYKRHILKTDYAEYFANRDTIVSERPVRIDGPKRWMTGDQGFQIDLTNENLEVFGLIKGVFTPDDEAKK